MGGGETISAASRIEGAEGADISCYASSVRYTATIIVPIRTTTYDVVFSLAEHYNGFVKEVEAEGIEVIVVDNSDHKYANVMRNLLDRHRI